MGLDRDGVITLYRRRAGHYDITPNLYYLLGFREWAYRERAVIALGLKPGDTVVDLGCGTGLNFSLLERMVGPPGRIVGVDVTDAMLRQARRRVARRGWHNVELVQEDAARFSFPNGVAGILSTFALTLVPEFDSVICKGADADLAARHPWESLAQCLPRGSVRESYFGYVYLAVGEKSGPRR